MNNKYPVRVTANEAGQVVHVSKNNPDYGYIRVEQTRPVFENGWTKKKTLSALISGTVDDLKSLNFKQGEELPGRIQIVEQLTEFNSVDPEKDYKMAGETGIVCCLDGEPIYRRTFYTEDASAQDITIAHNNDADIKAKYAEMKAAEAEVSEENSEL